MTEIAVVAGVAVVVVSWGDGGCGEVAMVRQSLVRRQLRWVESE